MPKQELFFSVLNELARQAKQAQPLAQWERYLQPGKVLTRGGAQFPLRKDEVEYGPLSILRRDVAGSLQESGSAEGLYGIADPTAAITPAELSAALENIAGMAGDVKTRGSGGAFGETQPAFVSLGPVGGGYRGTPGLHSGAMHYENTYQLPGPKLDQAEELTLLPGSDYVAQAGHFGGQPGLLSWSRTTRRPAGARALRPSERPDVMADFSVNDKGEVFQNVYYGGEGIKPVFRGNIGQNQTLGEFVDINYPRYGEGKIEEAWSGPTATHIEEIQSDWHQKAREQGYGVKPTWGEYARQHNVPEGRAQSLRDQAKLMRDQILAEPDEGKAAQMIYDRQALLNRAVELDREIYKARDTWNRLPQGVPPAPYKDTYAELELKKGIATAVERGDDYVTWTTGQQQIDRWSEALRSRVSAIEWHKKPNGKYDLAVFGSGNRRAMMPIGDLEERTTDLTEQDLKNLLGSEVADRIISGEGKEATIKPPVISGVMPEGFDVNDTSAGRAYNAFLQRRGDATESGLIEGRDLTVGGSGMRQFYDTKVKEAATRLAKQYGGEVTQVDLPSDVKPPQYPDEVEEDLGQLRYESGINLTEDQINELISRLGEHFHIDDYPEIHDILYDVGYAHIKLMERRDELIAQNEARIAALPPRTTPTEAEVRARWRNMEVSTAVARNDRDEEIRQARNNDMIERMQHRMRIETDPELNVILKSYNDTVHNLMKKIYAPKSYTQKVWALKITPEMKKRVLEAGLPLFSAAGLTVGAGRYGEQEGQPPGMAAGGQPGPRVRGLIEPGNIDLMHRPVVRNEDGSISTVLSSSFQDELGREVLVPGVTDDGRVLTPHEAKQLYYKTGRHLGIFDSPADATAYAEALHRSQEEQYAPAMAVGGQPRSYFELPGLPQLPQLAAFGLYDPQPPRPERPLPDPTTLDDRLEALTRLLSGEDRPDAEVVPEDKDRTVEPVERAGTVRPYDLAAAYGQRVTPRAEPAAPAPAAVNPAVATPAAPGMATPGPSYLDALMAAESGGDPDAASTTSSALGPFQFTEGTWADVAYRHPELDLGDDRTDPTKARLAAEALTADNAELLLDAGLEPTDLNLRAAHLLGARGAARFLMAAAALPGTPARDHVSPDAAAANPGLFTHKDGTPVTSAELLARLGRGFPGRTWAAARGRPAG